MRSIDEYNVEVMISLAVVMGGYALAAQLYISGPVAMAVAGLLIGNKGVADAMSDTTRDYLLEFWALIDDILNAVLFLLIGLEVVTISWDPRLIALGLAAIPLVLLARGIAVVATLAVLRPILSLGRLAPLTLIWGGLRGGISVALAPWATGRSCAVDRARSHLHYRAVLGHRPGWHHRTRAGTCRTPCAREAVISIGYRCQRATFGSGRKKGCRCRDKGDIRDVRNLGYSRQGSHGRRRAAEQYDQ